MQAETTARVLIRCPDRPGIVAAVSNFLYNHGANITALDQHSTDPEGGVFFMRLEFQTPHLDLSRAVLEREAVLLDASPDLIHARPRRAFVEACVARLVIAAIQLGDEHAIRSQNAVYLRNDTVEIERVIQRVGVDDLHGPVGKLERMETSAVLQQRLAR